MYIFLAFPTFDATCTGSSTACVLVLNRENNTVYTANIGDSGYIVVRNGEIVHKSDEQQHYFNTPFQLSLPPPGNNHVLSDSPQSADRDSFPVEDGDVILVATDGVFDNVPKNLLLDTLKEVEGERDQVKLQMTANTIAFMARSLSFDSEFMSPFAVNARKSNINTIGESHGAILRIFYSRFFTLQLNFVFSCRFMYAQSGGKPDDITVVLATVAL